MNLHCGQAVEVLASSDPLSLRGVEYLPLVRERPLEVRV